MAQFILYSLLLNAYVLVLTSYLIGETEAGMGQGGGPWNVQLIYTIINY